MRLGVLGGVFNPPHLGHLVAAQEAHARLGLDLVLWVPVGEAPHRVIEQDPGPEVRAEMTELAIAGDERFQLSRAELDRKGPSYTVDTLRALRESSPDDELFLILGGDQAAALPHWHEPEEVLTLATAVVFARATATRNAIGIQLSRLRGADRLRFVEMPRVDVSSTMVRRRVGESRPIQYLVPDKVADFIEAQGLYAAPTPSPITAAGR